MDRLPEVEESEVQTFDTIVYASPVVPAGGYCLSSSICGVSVSFLLDTGAAVTLLREDIWAEISTRTHKTLKPWSAVKLVGAGGAPLAVHGCANIELELGSEKFSMDVVMVSPLTSDAILGVDFLSQQQASIDLASWVLHL